MARGTCSVCPNCLLSPQSRVSLTFTPFLPYEIKQNYEVIGSPPNVAVPTHFAKVVLASRPSSPSTPNVPEISTGAFVLPNTVIPDEASFESFVMPGTHGPASLS